MIKGRKGPGFARLSEYLLHGRDRSVADEAYPILADMSCTLLQHLRELDERGVPGAVVFQIVARTFQKLIDELGGRTENLADSLAGLIARMPADQRPQARESEQQAIDLLAELRKSGSNTNGFADILMAQVHTRFYQTGASKAEQDEMLKLLVETWQTLPPLVEISVPFTAEERAIVEKKAAAAGLTVSEYCLLAARGRAGETTR